MSALTRKNKQYAETLTTCISVIGSLMLISMALYASSHAYSRGSM